MTSANDHMGEREAEKAEALAEIAAALSALDGRDPDHWERVCLVRAFAAICSGGYSLAATEARLAQTPQEERSQESKLPSDPLFDQCNLSHLWKLFEAARAEPVKRFPHFGSVELKVAPTRKSGKAWLR